MMNYTYCNDSLQTSVELVEILKHMLHALINLLATLSICESTVRKTYAGYITHEELTLLLEIVLFRRRAIDCG